MTKAERKAKKAMHAARQVTKRHAEIEQQAVATIDALSREVEILREVQERFRGHVFGAFLARALGDEPKFSDAVMACWPEWFRGKEARPWEVFSSQQ